MGSVKKNFFYNTFSQILNILIPIITTPYLARVLGAEKTGIYSYSYTITTYFILFVMLGLNNYGNRTIATVRDNKELLSKTFWSIYCMQHVTGIVVSTLYFLYAFGFSNDLLTWILYIPVLAAILDINWFFYGLEEFKLTVLRNSVIRVITTILIFVFVKNKDDLLVYAFISVMGTLCGQLVLWPFLKRFIKRCKISRLDVLGHVKSNFILFVPVIAISLYKYMDKIMLGRMSSMTQVGYYEYTERIMQIPMTLINSLGIVMLPKMSMLSAKGKVEEIKKYINFSLIGVVLCSSAASFGIMGISKPFVRFFLGKELAPCSILLKILLPSCVFLAFANVIRTQYLIPQKKDKIYIISVFMGAIINLLLNSVLIGKFGACGAAIATLFAEIVVCIYQVFCIRNEFNIKKMIANTIPYVLSGIFMFCFLSMLNFNVSCFAEIIIKVLLGAIVYLIMTAFIYIITKPFEVGKEMKNFFKIVLREVIKEK